MKIRILVAVVVCLLAPALPAQTTGDLKGIITDPSGAAIPSAQLSLTNRDTAETRVVASDGEGRYMFALLKIGDYTVTVRADGFRQTTAAVSVRSAEVASLNLKLEVGQVTEQVVVTDAANPLDTQSAQVQEAFEIKEVQEIPVNRNPNALATTLPGIVPAPGGFNSGSFVANGNRVRANNITIDNITATDISTAGTGSSNNSPLNFSSIREVKVITNAFSAEFGRNSGAQVQYITKSGGNQFHGETYEYLQNDIFNARDWFDRGGQPSVTRVNDFGGVLGGPVVRNRTHFFGSASRYYSRGSGAARVAQVPTAAMLARVTDPTSKKVLEMYALPAATTVAEAFGTVQQNASNKVDLYQYSARLDHQISSRDSIYGRYGFSTNQSRSSNNTFIQTNLANFGLGSNNSVYSVNVNETHIFSATVVNEFRAGFGRTSPIFFVDSTAPLGSRIAFSNAQVDRFGSYEGGPQGRVQNTFQYSDTLTWNRGAHAVKFGGDFFRYQLNSFFDSQSRGVYTFLNWDDFAAGRPNNFVQAFGSTGRGGRTWLQSLFAQDDYRITPRLTLNLGVRLELYGPVKEVNQLSSNLDFNCRQSMGLAGTGPYGCLVTGRDSIGLNRYLQPRVGVAWNPGQGKTVFRAGYGLVADFNFMNPVTNQRFLPPIVITQTITGMANFTGGNSWANLIAGSAPIQQEGLGLTGKLRTDVLNYGDVNPTIDPGLKNPQVHQWNVGVERQLPDGMVLKVSYAGTKGNFLQRHRQVNLNAQRSRAAANLADESARTQEFVASYNSMTGATQRSSTRQDPRFNAVNYYDNSANSNYHAMEALLTRPFRGGYSLQAAYTWAKSIDDVSDGISAIPNDSAAVLDPTNFRNNRAISGFDIPHRVVVMHVWEPPWGSRLANPVLRRMAAGWGFSGITSWRSGFPLSFDAGARLGLANISAITTDGISRPNASGPVRFIPLPAGSAEAPQGLNGDPVAARRIATYAESIGLSQPLLGNFGGIGRNTHRANGQADFDWNVFKSTRINERILVQVRCEIYNVFNHHAFRDVNRNISNPGFGQYTTPSQSQRFMQVGALVRF
ncbi:MAG: carboxypeptidase regulatory-like domain-containing protein [Bryobacterales bacterium]|nr:carboxypeptidase regulatory-like domain-containing protein [Bryobacterales bacterium]